MQTHGHVRTTNDAGLIPAPNPANLKRLASALLARGRPIDLADVAALTDPEAEPS